MTSPDRMLLDRPGVHGRPGALRVPARMRAARFLFSQRGIRLVGSAVVVVGFVLAVLAAADRYAYTSDDVAVQNIITSVERGAPFAPIIGADNFALKVPVYVLVGLLLPNGTAALTTTVLLCNVPLVLALLVLTNRATVGRSRGAIALGLLLDAWFLASRISVVSSLMEPTGRNGEIGILLLLLD